MALGFLVWYSLLIMYNTLPCATLLRKFKMKYWSSTMLSIQSMATGIACMTREEKCSASHAIREPRSSALVQPGVLIVYEAFSYS